MPTDERGVRALLLAQAEVQLVAVHRALREFEAETPKLLLLGKKQTFDDIREGLLSGEIPHADMTMTYPEISRHIKARKEEYKSVERRLKLLNRYLGEARAQRRKALSAWLAANRGAEMAA